MLLLERDGVIEEELRSMFEDFRDVIAGKVLEQQFRDVGEEEGEFAGQGIEQGGRESGESIVGADSDARDGPIGEDKNGSDRVDVLLDLTRNTLVELVLLDTASVGKPRRVENANLGRKLGILVTTLNTARTYHPAVFAREFVKADQGSPTGVVRATLLVGMVEDVKVVVINIIPGEDIGDELQE